ncbi:MAG TPA: RDD family protein [Pseudobdellovibrionaceae bacterium]|nr:RDD family protein [Pseudobdellovibrionaceae bacterium]
MTDVPSTALRVWAKAVDDLMITVLLVPAFGFSAFSLFSGEPIWISWPFLAYLLVVPLLYEGLALWIFGTTFGKWLFFLRVVPARDPARPLEAGQAFTRALTGKFSFFFSYALQSMAIFRYDRTHVADWLGGTRVITDRPRPRQVTIHWMVGSLAFVVMFLTGMAAASLFLQGISFESTGLVFFPFKP